MENLPWELIQHKLRNPNSEDEIFTTWLKKDAGNEKFWNELKVIYSITGNVSESFIPNKDLAWNVITSRITIKKHKINFIQNLLRVAGLFLLISLSAGVGYFMLKQKPVSSYSEVYSPFGHKTMVILPDSSQVWLNGNSRIRYQTDFADGRIVQLTGEALFQVTKNPNKIFKLNSSKLQLEVYGTTFNVKSYNGDVLSEVALIEGSIGVFSNEHLLKKMIPGEVLVFDNQKNNFTSIQGNMNQIKSWKADELVIENETFENVIKYLERWYGVEITLDEKLKNTVKLSFKVKTESLTELLSIIDHITPIKYEINGKQVKIMKKP
jgi:transmembrane sensor